MKIWFRPKKMAGYKAMAIPSTGNESLDNPSDAKPHDAYFGNAASWADDWHAATIASRTRYQIAFLSMACLSIVLAIAVVVLAPMQQTELVVLHEGDSGYTWLSTAKPNVTLPVTFAQTASEIAHYVRARESYDPVLYAYQAQEVKALSTLEVNAEYELSQASNYSHAPINALGAKGYRTVVIHNVLPLDSGGDNKNGKGIHENLVQVDFVVVDHFFGESRTLQTPYTALVSWRYAGVPSNPSQLFNDWDGFTITKYQVEPVNTISTQIT